MNLRLLTLLLAGSASLHAAHAQDLRPLCPDRPGLGTPACTVDVGHVLVEVGGFDWTLDKNPEERSDTIVAGDLLLRYGVAEHAEVQLGWTVFGSIRTRDRRTGTVYRSSGTGDVTLALRRNLSNPDGSGLSAAVMPYVTLPTGGVAIGARDWGMGVVAPISYELNDVLSLAVTPELDAAVDQDRRGRHIAYGGVVGLNVSLSNIVSGALELQALRDEDPEERTTEALASFSIAWQPEKDLQLDAGAVAGLNPASADVQVYFGIARRF